MEILLTLIIGVILGAALVWFFTASLGKSATNAAKEMEKRAKREAKNILQEAKIKAKEEVLDLRDDFDKSIAEKEKDLKQKETRLTNKEVNVEKKMDVLQQKMDDIQEREKQIISSEITVKKKQEVLEKLHKQETLKLESISVMTCDQARVQLMQKLDRELVNERGKMIRRSVEETKKRIQKDARKLLIQTMQRCAGDCVHERTTVTVDLPSDEMKGRIIGRDGRNIRIFEALTGINVLIDDTPSGVVLTGFNPVRLDTARLAMQRLIEDGRIHPTRVEEMVKWAEDEIKQEIIKAGEYAVHEVQIGETSSQIIEVLGKLKYRYSYSQNVLEHSIEVARFMATIAAELGLNTYKAKRMGLFHDIGKALDKDIEGPHAIIGKEFLKRLGEDAEVINGVGCHHGEIPAETPLASLVSVCDALSASRPGARSETTEFYIKRLEQLESIGKSFSGVENCYAIQAGREIRITVTPGKISDDKAITIARDVVRRIEKEMQFPGQIKVSVIRETRAIEYAR